MFIKTNHSLSRADPDLLYHRNSNTSSCRGRKNLQVRVSTDPKQGKNKNKGVNKCVEKFSISRRLNEAVSAEGRQMMLLATINPSKMDLN